MEELRAENASLRDTNALLTDENHRLVSRNLALSEQLDAWHDTRMRVQLLKELLVNDRRRMARADLKDDVELLALIEARVEKEKPHLQPDFDAEAACFVTTRRTTPPRTTSTSAASSVLWS